MADQTLALVYSTTTGRVTQSGLTGNALPDVVRLILAQQGIVFPNGSMVGRLIDKNRFTHARHRATIITTFNAVFDQDPNPYHATDNITVTLTSV